VAFVFDERVDRFGSALAAVGGHVLGFCAVSGLGYH
jgi:hypothetical protein